MSKRFRTLALAIVILLVSRLTGATACAQTLSLKDCIQLALQKNARLVAAGYEVRAAEQRLKEARTFSKPSANLHGGASLAQGLDPALTEGGEYVGLLEIKQPLYDATIHLNRQQAEVGRQQAEHAQIRTAADIRLEVRQAYIDWLNARRQHALLEQSSKDLNFYLETVRALANGGAAPKTDVMKVEIQLQSELIALNDWRVATTTAMTRLLEPLGLPLDTTITIQDSVALPSIPPSFVRNPDLKEFGLVITAAELEVKLAQKERRPVLSAFGSAGAWTSRNQLLEADSPRIFGYQAGVSLDLPIFNWGATAARLEQKIAERGARGAEYEVLQRRLNTEFQTSFAQYRAAAEKIIRLRESRQRADEQYDLLVAQYAGGGKSALEVLEAHRAFLDIALQEEQTRSDLDMLHAQLLRLTGEPE